MRDIIPYRVGEWLPSDQEQLQTWICALALEASDETIKLHPVIEDFKNLIETDAEVYMLFNLMFTGPE